MMAGNFAEEAPESQSREMPRSHARLRSLSGVNVLVVDDEPDAREVVGELLATHGAEVELTASVAEAYGSVMRHRPDVIVSDIGMPGEDGYELVRRLRALGPERGGTTPIVALTAYASAQDRRRSREAGIDVHLTKPVDTEELVGVLVRLSRRPVRPS